MGLVLLSLLLLLLLSLCFWLCRLCCCRVLFVTVLGGCRAGLGVVLGNPVVVLAVAVAFNSVWPLAPSARSSATARQDLYDAIPFSSPPCPVELVLLEKKKKK